jgi:hypothetical protein
MKARTLVTIYCAGAILAGCGGRTASPLPAGQAQTGMLAQSALVKPATAKSASATLTIVVSVPRNANPSLHKISPRNISPGARGMKLDFKGPEKLKEAFGLTHASDPHCKNANAVTICTFTLQLSTGKYTVNVAMFDKSPVGGRIPTTAKLLALANAVPLTMKSGKANRLKVRPGGVIASLTISGLPSGTAGTAFASAQSFAVTARDADGYVVVGPYESAVTLADNDATGATTIATSGSDKPPKGQLLSSSDTATLNYSGLAIVPATITASTSGATNGTGTFTPALQPIVIETNDTLNPSFGGVDLYATSGAGSTGSFSASEVGWTNAPYNNTLSASASGCTTIATLPTSGTSFTVTVASSPSAGTCAATIRDPLGQTQAVPLAYTNFVYTGAQQSIAIPSGVTHIAVTAVGAAGSNNFCGSTPGHGASVSGTLSVTSGNTLYVYVAGQGFNGGAGDGNETPGGDASDVRTSLAPLTGGPGDPRIIVAGGGGATGCTHSGAGTAGGDAGALGTNGSPGTTSTDGGGGGGGGTQSAGGAGGTSTNCTAFTNGGSGSSGSPGQGGLGSGETTGNGGGGWYGGGGGALGGASLGGGNCSQSGVGGAGGGSSFIESSATNTSSTAGANTNSTGQVTIIY